MGKLLTIVGIALVLLGTIWAVWSVLMTNSADVAKARYKDSSESHFKKQKMQVIIGLIISTAGSIIQIIGVLI